MLLTGFVLTGLYFSLRDIRSHRIRRKDVYLGLAILAPVSTVNSVLCSVTNFLFYFSLYAVSQRRMGFGDVRLAALLGSFAGIFYPNLHIVAEMNILSWTFAGTYALLRKQISEQRLNDRIALAPFMFVGLAIRILVDEIWTASAIII